MAIEEGDFNALVEVFLDIWDGEEDVADVLHTAWQQLQTDRCRACLAPATHWLRSENDDESDPMCLDCATDAASNFHPNFKMYFVPKDES